MLLILPDMLDWMWWMGQKEEDSWEDLSGAEVICWAMCPYARLYLYNYFSVIYIIHLSIYLIPLFIHLSNLICLYNLTIYLSFYIYIYLYIYLYLSNLSSTFQIYLNYLSNLVSPIFPIFFLSISLVHLSCIYTYVCLPLRQSVTSVWGLKGRSEKN